MAKNKSKTTTKKPKQTRRVWNSITWKWMVKDKDGNRINCPKSTPKNMTKFQFARVWLEHLKDDKSLQDFCKRYCYTRYHASVTRSRVNKHLAMISKDQSMKLKPLRIDKPKKTNNPKKKTAKEWDNLFNSIKLPKE